MRLAATLSLGTFKTEVYPSPSSRPLRSRSMNGWPTEEAIKSVPIVVWNLWTLDLTSLR